jgi:hypothetical protein
MQVPSCSWLEGLLRCSLAPQLSQSAPAIQVIHDCPTCGPDYVHITVVQGLYYGIIPMMASHCGDIPNDTLT